MAVETIKISREDIRETEFFGTMDKVVQDLTLRKMNVMAIEHGVNVSKNIGFEKWDQISADRWTNRQIIKELLTIKTKNREEVTQE